MLHVPTARRKCDACHTLVDALEHRFAPTVPLERLCASCHVQTHRTFVHEPVLSGDCTGCHDPHGSDHRFLLLDDPAKDLCYRCHPREEFGDRKHVHGPVAAGACILCHEPHSSWNPKLLVTDERKLCQTCHADVMAELELSRHTHEPVLEGRCLQCHDPHASDHSAQLRAGAPQLCFSCHEHDDIRQRIEVGELVHGAISTPDSCTACHTGHGSFLPKLLAEPPMNLCLSCHSEAVEVNGGRRPVNMAALLRDNPNHHGPIRRADCSACHDPHVSPNFQLLLEAYPKTFYAPFNLDNYRLCFKCHFEELVTAENGRGATGFRDGERNLHFIHVNKEEKGRTCRACHEVHASQRPFHIREAVPFGDGGWEIEINFETSPDGGRCAPGCHEPLNYRRNPAPAERDADSALQADGDG